MDSDKKLKMLTILTGLIFIGFTLFVCYAMLPEEARTGNTGWGQVGMITHQGTESTNSPGK